MNMLLETQGAHERRWKRYPTYRDSEVEWLGAVPEGWEIKTLKRTFKTLNGSTPKSGRLDYWGGDIPWATPDDLGQLKDNTLRATQRMITIEGYNSCGTSTAPSGSLVLSTRAPIGHLAIAGTDMCTNQGCRCLVFRADDDSHFFYYQLLAARLELESLGQGSTFKELGRGNLEGVYLATPSISEQRAIAAFLDRETGRIDTLIATKERQIELLQEKRAALISHAVTRGLDPDAPMKDSGVEWLGEVPEGWKIRKLKHIASVKFSSVDKKTEEGEQPVCLCNYVDVYYNDYITSDLDLMKATASVAEIQNFTLRGGDILITKDSESWDDIAVPAYVSSDINNVLCGYHLAQIRPNISLSDGEYLFRSFYARGINDQFRVAATGVTRYGLGKYWLDNSLFLVPPLPEQHTIATFLDHETGRNDILITKIRESIAKLREYRTSLISAAVTGKIDVREESAP